MSKIYEWLGFQDLKKSCFFAPLFLKGSFNNIYHANKDQITATW